jgi:hypothetical protein
MTSDKKSIEFFFGATTYIMIVLSIVVRDDMNAPDKLLTVAMIQGVGWLAKIFFRMNKDKILDLNDTLGATVTPVKTISRESLVSAPAESGN